MPVIVEGGLCGFARDATLRAMFEDRKSVFIDLLKWDLPVLDHRFELDEFDNQHATYIIIASEDGDHLGSARLLPTNRRHILGSLFPHLCAAPPPRGPAIFEITRFCLSPRHNALARRDTRNRLVSALAWYAIEQEICTYTGVAEFSWLQQILAFGWDCRPLGLPVQLECGLLAALAIEITPDTPHLLSQNGIWENIGEPALRIPEAA